MSLREPWRTRLLFLSFAVNLVAVPMAAMPLFRHRQPPLPPGGPPARFIIDRMAEHLSEDDAHRLRAAMEPHLEQIQIERIHMDVARRQMMRILAEPEFDRNAARMAMGDFQGSWTKWSRALGEAMLDGFEQLSPTGRQTLGHVPDRSSR